MTTSPRSQTVVLRSIVESKAGAVVKVQRIELTQAGTSMLTTAVKGIEQSVVQSGNDFAPPVPQRERVSG